ncbi:hypothetical protein Hanom_Chr11g00997221 [Helianthus anomalus]
MHTMFSRRSSPLLFDPEIEKTARQNLVLRLALKGKAPISKMNPLENQPNLNQQPPKQEPLPDMPPPPFPPKPQKRTQTQNQQNPPPLPQQTMNARQTPTPQGEFHLVGGAHYPVQQIGVENGVEELCRF